MNECKSYAVEEIFAVGTCLIFGRQSDCATRNFADKKHSAIKAGEPKHCTKDELGSAVGKAQNVIVLVDDKDLRQP